MCAILVPSSLDKKGKKVPSFIKHKEAFSPPMLSNQHGFTLKVKAQKTILLRGIHLTLVQRYKGSTVKMVFSYKIFTFYEANTRVALPNV
jgi:hypothetical protein